MNKFFLIKDVADSLAIGPRVMADFEGKKGFPLHVSKMRTINEIKYDPQNEFHKLLIKFKGLTLGELFEYLDESGIPYVTNGETVDFWKALDYFPY